HDAREGSAMKRLLAGTLGLSLGWWTAAGAEELTWRTATPQSSRTVSLGRPVPLAEETAGQPVADSAVRTASTGSAPRAASQRVVRAKADDVFALPSPRSVAAPDPERPLPPTAFANDQLPPSQVPVPIPGPTPEAADQCCPHECFACEDSG